MQQFETIKFEKHPSYEHVYQLTLNRPNSLNALNTKMALEIIELFEQLQEDDDVRTMIITGSGTRSFCVGADLKEREGMTNEQWKEQHDIFEEAYQYVREFPFPTIAAINGFALGGGMELALQCDLRIGSNSASIALPEASLGIIPGLGGAQMLVRLLPITIAKQLLFTASRVPVKALEHYGLFNDIVADEQLLSTAAILAKHIARNAPLSLQALKQSIHNGIHKEIDHALSMELEHYYTCVNSEDRLEGIHSFNEKRKPNWKNR